MHLIGLSALAIAAATSQAGAAPLAGTTLQPGRSCELHVWPAERLEGLAFNLYNGLIAGRASGDQIEASMDDLISPAAQIAALRTVDIPAQLGLPATTRVVMHEEPLDRKTLNKVKNRRATSPSACYYELAIMQHLLVEDIVWGDRFLSTYMFRDFAGGQQAKTVLKGTGGNKLKVLTQAKAARPADAPVLVAAAVQANFTEECPAENPGGSSRRSTLGRFGAPRQTD